MWKVDDALRAGARVISHRTVPKYSRIFLITISTSNNSLHCLDYYTGKQAARTSKFERRILKQKQLNSF